MRFTLLEIAGITGGEPLGAAGTLITGVRGLEEAREGDISFVAGRKQVAGALVSAASAFLVRERIPEIDKPQVKVEDPLYAFALLLGRFYVKEHPRTGISTGAFVAPGARVAATASVYPFAYLADGASVGERTVIYPGAFVGGGASIGSDCVIYPNVVIRDSVIVGDRVIIHPGSVLGADGFGYVPHGGVHHKIPQVGGVVVGDDVEIGAGVMIDRATTGNTVIGKGTKIDNLVQVGHNAVIGAHCVIVAQTAIGGSARIGDGVVIGGQCGIADHSVLEGGSMFAARSGTMGEVGRGVYGGAPCMPHREWLKSVALYQKLPEISRRLGEIEEAVRKLQKEEG